MKPLKYNYELRGQSGRIQYEGLHSICFQCGIYGHSTTACPQIVLQNSEQETATHTRESSHPVTFSAGNNIVAETMQPGEAFGPWMIARRNRRRSSNQNQNSGGQPPAVSRPPTNANRFMLLESARNECIIDDHSGNCLSGSHVSNVVELAPVAKAVADSGMISNQAGHPQS